MALKQQLRGRWTALPGSSVRQRVIEFLSVLSIGHGKGSEDLFNLLEGLPYREEVANGRDLRGSDCGRGRELDLSATDFSFSTQFGDFFDCNLSDARFDEIKAERCSFGNVIRSASFRKANLRSCYLMDVQANHCCFDDGKLGGTTFKNSDLSGSSFRNSNCKRVSFYNANLTGCDFRGAILDEAVFQGAELDKTTDFRGASLINAFHKEHRDNSGNFLAAGVDLRLAQFDATTKFGDAPVAFPLEILGRASEIAKEGFGSAGTKIASLLNDTMRTVRDSKKEQWQEDIVSRLDDREREVYEEIMDRTFKSLL